MAEDRKAGEEAPMSADELIRLQKLVNKRNEAFDTMSETVRKQQESQRGIIDRMR